VILISIKSIRGLKYKELAGLFWVLFLLSAELSDAPIEGASDHKKEANDDDGEFNPRQVIGERDIPLRDRPMKCLGQGDVLYDIAKGRKDDEPGETASGFDHDLVAGTCGYEPAAEGDGQGVQSHEQPGKIGACYPFFVFAGDLPIVDDGLGLVGRLGDLELDDLIGA
jgi:hypothetical protein